jgi:hypothetical protein
MELKSQDQKIMNYMRSIRKLTRFRNDNLTLLEQKFNAIKSQNTKAIDSLSARQDSNTKRRYLYATNFAINKTTK